MITLMPSVLLTAGAMKLVAWLSIMQGNCPGQREEGQ